MRTELKYIIHFPDALHSYLDVSRGFHMNRAGWTLNEIWYMKLLPQLLPPACCAGPEVSALDMYSSIEWKVNPYLQDVEIYVLGWS